MKALPAIDFLASQRQPWLGWGLATIFAAALAVSAFASWRVQQDTLAQAELLKLAQPAPAPPRPTLSAADRQLLAQARSIANQLNAPWDELLAVFEEHSTSSVGLLKLEPDAKAELVRLTALAGSTDDMVSYLATLETDARLTDVVLANHQVERDAPGHPVRFTLLASWRQAGVAAAPAPRAAQETP